MKVTHVAAHLTSLKAFLQEHHTPLTTTTTSTQTLPTSSSSSFASAASPHPSTSTPGGLSLSSPPST
jgi:hypothetical protein